MSENMAERMEVSTRVQGEAGSRQAPGQPVREALACLRESAVPFAVLHPDIDPKPSQTHVDVVVEPGEIEIAVAAVRRAGFREMRRDETTREPWIFLTYEGNRFHFVRILQEFVHAGLTCLDASLALSRRNAKSQLPVLAEEDRFLLLLLAAALEGRAPSAVERTQLVALRRGRLDMARLGEQTRPLGIQANVERAIADLDMLLQDRRAWLRFRLQLWSTLLRRPENLRAAWHAWKTKYLRFTPSVVIALVGPPNAGKTALANTLQQQLEDSPFAASIAPMSCWQGNRAWTRLVRGLAPAQISWWRLFRSRRGQRMPLKESELVFLRETQPGMARLACSAFAHGLRTVLFHAAVLADLRLRHLRGIARCRSPLVIADGWIFDVGFRHGREPFAHGDKLRRWVFRHVPEPDGILYLSTSYDAARSRNPQLTRTHFENVDHALRRFLRPLGPLEFVTDEPSSVIAQTFLRRYWAHLLARFNRHS